MRSPDIAQIEKLHDSATTDSWTANAASMLLGAINDWPKPTGSLDDFVHQVKEVVQGELNAANIERALSQIDVGKNAWQAESLTQIIQFLHLNSNWTSLDEAIQYMKGRSK